MTPTASERDQAIGSSATPDVATCLIRKRPGDGDTADRQPGSTDGPTPPPVAKTSVVAIGQPVGRVDSIPRPGDEWHGFDLVADLGRGAFGSVFLARQRAMADRQVVLKLGTHLSDESDKLAQLQHPNVAPVYSFHRGGALQAVCMPYLGPVTLAHVVSRLRDTDVATLDGRALSTVIQSCRRDKRPATAPSARTGPAVQPAPTPDAPTTDEVAVERVALPDAFKRFHFIDAVLWIGQQLAAGLAAAHARKIVHSDLKPANVLLSDGGQPMLLDFGVSVDRKARTDDLRIGGTRPYMAPEHLRSFRDEQILFDERSDLYSLGVILFELLANRLPFEPTGDLSAANQERELAVRAVAPSVRAVNPRVPVAVDAVLRKCMAADPADRYQTAEQVGEDLARQIARKPLRYAPNPSRLELAGKWATRNRWLLAVGGVFAVGGGAAGGFAARDAGKAERIAAFESLSRADRFDAAARHAQATLASGATTAADWENVIRAGEQALAPYRVLTDDRWWEQGAATQLPADRAGRLRERAAVLLLDLSRAAGVRATLGGKTGDRADWLAKAADWNQRAEQAFPGDSPRGVWTQRAWLARLAGDGPAAAEAKRTAGGIPLRTAIDYRIEGRELMESGNLKAAGEALKTATELDPTDFWATFNLGVASYRRGPRYDPQAVAAFDKCAAIDPTVPGVFFNRGLALLRSGRHQQAVADFTTVIEAKGDWADPYLNRATAREGLQQYRGAIADLTKAIDLGYPPTAVLLARSKVYAKMGDDDRAKADLVEGMKRPPTDERGWITRGVARMPKDGSGGLASFAGPLADFDQALALNPRSLHALQFKARVYSVCGENAKGVAALTELLEHHPETLDALSGRAMLYSRLGDRDRAHADAEEALRLGSDNARTVYQLAGVYAMTSMSHPADKREALRLLASVLRSGYGLDLLDQDRELDPLRSDAEFSQVVEDARRVVEKQTKK